MRIAYICAELLFTRFDRTILSLFRCYEEIICSGLMYRTSTLIRRSVLLVDKKVSPIST